MGRPSWAREARATASLKTVDLSGVPSGEYEFTAGNLSGLTEHGAFDIEVTFVPAGDFEGGESAAFVILKGDTAATRFDYVAGGTHAFQAEHQGNSLQFGLEKGQPWSAGDIVRVRMIRDPYSTALIGRMRVNDCVTLDVVDGGTSGAAIDEIATLWFGSDEGSPPELDAQIVSMVAHPLDASPPEPARGVILGDSTTGPLSSPAVVAVHPALGTYFPMPAGTACASIAKSGDRITMQTTTWQASRFRGAGEVRWVYASLGINDAIYSQSTDGATAADILARAQTLVDDIATQNPNARIFWELCTPCRTGLHVDAWAVLSGFNDLLRAGGLTGIDHLVTTAYDALDDGTGALAAEYLGDATHPNTAGMAARAAAVLAELAAAGFTL
jgi:hypothetical protein